MGEAAVVVKEAAVVVKGAVVVLLLVGGVENLDVAVDLIEEVSGVSLIEAEARPIEAEEEEDLLTHLIIQNLAWTKVICILRGKRRGSRKCRSVSVPHRPGRRSRSTIKGFFSAVSFE